MATTESRVFHRRDTLANWLAADPVLGIGEMAVELDTSGNPTRVKIGNGVDTYSNLPYLGAGLIPYASAAEVQAATAPDKVVSPKEGAEYVLRNPASPAVQLLGGPVKFGGATEIDLAPRAGTAGDKDAINRIAMQAEIAASKTPADTSGGVPDAGLAPKLNSVGALDSSFLPSFLASLSYKGGFDPTDANGDAGNGSRALEDVAGGGIGASAGWFVMATTTGFWDLGTGSTDAGPAGGTVIAVTASDLLIFDGSAWVTVSTSGIVDSNMVKRDGSVTMDGDLTFSATQARKLKFAGGGTIEGESDSNRGVLSYMTIDCGSF